MLALPYKGVYTRGSIFDGIRSPRVFPIRGQLCPLRSLSESQARLKLHGARRGLGKATEVARSSGGDQSGQTGVIQGVEGISAQSQTESFG